MGDIVKIISNVGRFYSKDEKRVKNKAHEYQTIQAYLCDIETKIIEPNLNIPHEKLIVCRFGVGANSGNLFPNQPFLQSIKKDIDKFIRGILKSKDNLLSCFDETKIQENEILKTLSSIDETFFTDLKEQINNLSEYKQKGIKTATYFCLSYNELPISAYFEDVFEKHISQKETSNIYGYDILTNKEGVGGDANLPFCSVNELPIALQSVKPKLLPLDSKNASYLQNGFKMIDSTLSYSFFGYKMAILPTILSKDETLLEKILNILEKASKSSIKDIEQSEEYVNYILESVAKDEENLPVLNTILFYNKNNAAIELLLQIDDVLPSYISNISKQMSKIFIKSYHRKDDKNTSDYIYMENLFESRLEVMDFLLSSKKVSIDYIIDKYAKLIYQGNINLKYAHKIEWDKYFNGYYFARDINAIKRYQALFDSINILKQSITIQKEIDMDEVKNIKNDEDKILHVYEKSEFIHENEVLKSAYLLGMLSSALINWQYGINKGSSSSYKNWLNNSGSITKESLERIWTKSDETIRKLESTSGNSNKNVLYIKELLLQNLPQTFTNDKVIKNSYVTLAFAMGGSDFNKYVKKETKSTQDK